MLDAGNTSNTRDSVSSGYPNTEKRVENTTRSGVFLTKKAVKAVHKTYTTSNSSHYICPRLGYHVYYVMSNESAYMELFITFLYPRVCDTSPRPLWLQELPTVALRAY